MQASGNSGTAARVRHTFIALALSLCAASRAEADAIIFVASTANSPPLNIFQQDKLTGGIVKDVGDAIAARMGRTPSYLTLPRKRIEQSLASAAADAICYAQPDWYSITLNWSRSFIPNTGVVVMADRAPALSGIADLRGQVLGTVFGFYYPQIDAVIGTDYKRDEAPSETLNLEKLKGGRLPYAVVDQLVLAWESRQHPELRSLRTMPLPEIKAACALSPKSSIPVADFSAAINSLIDDGSMQRIFLRYR